MAKAWEKYYGQKQEYEAVGNLDYYNWEETKIILVNSEFEDWVIKLAENKKNGIILGKIGAIQVKGEYLLYINTEGREGKNILTNRLKKKVNSKNNEVEGNINNNNNEYQKLWKEKTSKWVEEKVEFLKQKFPLLSFSPKKYVGTDVLIKDETILTFAWKDGRLKNPKLFLVEPNSLLKEKHTKKILKDVGGGCWEYIINVVKENDAFYRGDLLLTDFIKEKVQKCEIDHH
jgi:hypothetical protein